MRKRGAKATDIVVVVVSSIEGVMRQTIEVLDLVKKYELPMIVALNKIDHPNADADSVILKLIDENIELDEVGGTIPSARVSALTKQGLHLLEDKITELAEKLKLKADYDCDADCLIVESKVHDESSQITASVVIRKGTLNVEDSFI